MPALCSLRLPSIELRDVGLGDYWIPEELPGIEKASGPRYARIARAS
jgi:hypothetical protein